MINFLNLALVPLGHQHQLYDRKDRYGFESPSSIRVSTRNLYNQQESENDESKQVSKELKSMRWEKNERNVRELDKIGTKVHNSEMN